jgi:hypothetical protein
VGYIYKISCDSCYYQVDDIVVGDAKHAIAVCTHCRQIRNPELPLFRFHVPHCVVCDNELRNERPEFCPRCNGPLKYHQRIHFTLIVEDRYPEPGAIVHAYFDQRRGKWDLPKLWLRAGRLEISDVPHEAKNRVIEAEVIEILKDAEGRASTIRLAFVRPTAIERPTPF